MPLICPPPETMPCFGGDPASASSRPVRVVVFGRHSNSWNEALAPGAPVWTQVPGVADVVVVPDARQPLPAASRDMRTIVLPLMEWHLLACGRDRHEGLFPQPHAVETLADKGTFAAFTRREGLERSCPPVFASIATADLPCVIKRLDLNAGSGVEVASSREELERLATAAPWVGFPVVLQGYIPHEEEYVTHAVCRDGRFVLHRTYRMALKSDLRIRRTRSTRSCEPAVLTGEQLATLESFLLPLHYDGPCNIDYVLREDGSVCVFEVNPRLGGSLMAEQNRPDLAAVLAAIIRHAVPLAAQGQLA